MSPVAEADAHDLREAVVRVVPGVTAKGDDVLIAPENAIREPVLAQVLPDVLELMRWMPPRAAPRMP